MSYVRTTALLLFAMLHFVLQSKAQHPYYYNLNNENGLPSNEVYQVRQDGFGYIWIACDAGLFRYDGLSFVTFANKSQNSKSVSNIEIDKTGNIWCQNFTGQVFKVKANSDSLTIIYNDSRTSVTFPSYTVDKKGRAWIATDSAILIVDDNGKAIKELPSDILFGSTWSDIKCGEDGLIYACDAVGNYAIIFPDTYRSLKNKAPAPGAINTLLRIGNKMMLYVEARPGRKYSLSDITGNTYKSIATYTPSAEVSRYYTIANTPLGPILCTSSGAIVLQSNYEETKQALKLFPGQKISSCFVDRENNYWFTSLQNGIFVVPSPHVRVYNNVNSHLTDENISTITRDGESLLVGTYNGDIYELSTNTDQLQLRTGQSAAQNRAVKKILMYGGKLYAAQGNFHIYDKGRKESVADLHNTRDFVIVSDTIYYTGSHSTGFVAKKNGIWIRSIIRKKGGKKVAQELTGKQIIFACTDGLFSYKQGNTTEIKFGNNPIFASCLLSDNDTLWIGTTNMGLLAYSNGKVVSAINSLPDMSVKAIEKSGKSLFVATIAGISAINLKDGKTELINEYDGVACKEVNALALIGTTLYAATIRGIISMPVNLHYKNIIPPPIKIIRAKKNSSALPLSQNIELKYNDNNLTIGLSCASLRSRGSFRYKYRLRGFDNEWRYINGNNPQVNFSSLPPGSYVFEAYAINEDGIISPKPAFINIVVSAPTWRQWWFITLTFCVVLGIILVIFRERLRYVKRKGEERNKLIASQLTALKAQMNPHFMYNALNSIQAFIINNDVKNSNLYLNKFSKLMRKVLDASDAEQITLQDEIEILELYLSLEQFRFGSDFYYNIVLNEDIDAHNTYIPSMILQPFIENAIKHGLLHKKGNKVLNIRFEIKEHLLCTITDNGIGRKRSEEIRERAGQYHRPFATGATEKRIELLNAYANNKYSFEITDLFENGQPAGTKVTIHIPS